MAYVTASELVLDLPNVVGTVTGSSTPLTIGEVATVAERISIELDGAAAAAGYAIPIPTTATQAYGQMALYQSWGVKCQVLRDIFPGGAGNAAELPLAQDYCNDYKAVLAMIRDGSQPLVNAPPDSGEGVRELPRSYSTAFPTATAGVVPQLSVGQSF